MFWATDAISIKVKLGGAATTTELPITGCYTEVGATGSIVGFGNIHTITTGGTAVSVVGVASAGNLRKLQGLRLVNVDTVAATVTVYQDDGTAHNAIVVTLGVGDQLHVFDNGEWFVRDANGDQHQSGTYAPYDADYLVKTANSGLSAERVVTDTTPITWDWGTAGQAKATIAGATTLYGALDALTVTGANVASATTTDIGAATGESITITGTTTITGLGTKAAGCLRFVTFSGALTLTYNATSLILPTAANITTAAGDAATFVSLGSGNWKCLSYSRASGAALASSGSSSFYGQRDNLGIAATGSAGALTISLAVPGGGNPSSGTPVTVTFRSVTAADGTYYTRSITSATSLVLSSGSTLGITSGKPARIWLGMIDWVSGGSQQIFAMNCYDGACAIYPLRDFMLMNTTAEGGAGAADSAGVAYTGTSVTGGGSAIRIIGYLEWTTFTTAGTWTTPDIIQIYGAGVPLPGEVVQVAGNRDNVKATGTTAWAYNDSVPTTSSGDQYMSQAITPKSAANILSIYTRANFSASVTSDPVSGGFFQDSTSNSLLSGYGFQAGASNGRGAFILEHTIFAGTTSSTTMKLRAGISTGPTTTFNGNASSREFGGNMYSFMTVKELMG